MELDDIQGDSPGEALVAEAAATPIADTDHRGKTITGRLWTYVRDDRPFAGPAPRAALFHYSRDRGREHPGRHLAEEIHYGNYCNRIGGLSASIPRSGLCDGTSTRPSRPRRRS